MTRRSLNASSLAAILLLLGGTLPAMGGMQTIGNIHLSYETPTLGEAFAIVMEPRSDRLIDTVQLLDANGQTITQAAAFDLNTALMTTQAVILGIPTTALTGNAYLKLKMNDGSVNTQAIFIQSRAFVTETIGLDKTNTSVRTSQPVPRDAESEEFWRILTAPPTPLLTTEVFIPPVDEKRRTSFFGDRRMYYYNNGVTTTTIHAGIDFGVSTGTIVRASAAGRVVFAKSRQVSGLTVILDHGAGIFSLYFHLKSVDVGLDDYVRAGDQLGLSGATGLATGPHLHWEIRAAGEAVDPDRFLSADAVTAFLRSYGARAIEPKKLTR